MRSRLGIVFALAGSGSDPNQIIVNLALRKVLAGCDSVLDVGCGASPRMRWLGVPHPVGAEGYPPSVEQARRLNTHEEIIECDVRQLASKFQPRQFDACIALDVIEHLEKPNGFKLIEDMERIARKRVIFFTPSGFLSQGHTESGDLQVHLSGWEPDEMRARGYRVIGLLGPKGLRGEYHNLKRSPAAFWGMVSLMGHFFVTRNRPEKAAAILCVKDLAT